MLDAVEPDDEILDVVNFSTLRDQRVLPRDPSSLTTRISVLGILHFSSSTRKLALVDRGFRANPLIGECGAF